jgi:hypothetical protein
MGIVQEGFASSSTRFCFHSFARPAVPMSNIVWNGFEV